MSRISSQLKMRFLFLSMVSLISLITYFSAEVSEASANELFICRSSTSKLNYVMNVTQQTLEVYASMPNTKMAEYSEMKLSKTRNNSDDIEFTNFKPGMLKEQTVKFFVDKKPNAKGHYEAQFSEDENIYCKRKIADF